jgi:hypothetical protein
LKNNVSDLFNSHNYANAKNLASYFLGESIYKPEDWTFFYLAQSASALGDYYMADEIFRYYLHARPEFKMTTISEIKRNAMRRRLCEPPKMRFYNGVDRYFYKELEYEPLTYDENFAKNAFAMVSRRGTMNYFASDKKAAFFELLKRLSFSFSAIKKPIDVYLVKGSDDFQKVFDKVIKPLDAKAAFTWKGAAVGFYTDPTTYILFADYKYIEKDVVKTAGCMAHELMHFEQNNTGLHKIFLALPIQKSGFKEKESKILNERVTDLQVIAKGYGYELHCDRRDLGMHCITNFDQYDVLKIIDAGSQL